MTNKYPDSCRVQRVKQLTLIIAYLLAMQAAAQTQD